MDFNIVVHPSGRSFSAAAGETVLDAALRQGITLPHGCRDGACGACKGKLVAGRVEHGPHQERALSADDERAGFALFCCAVPRTDIEIESHEVAAAGVFPVRKMPARIASITRAADDVVIVRLQLPAAERFEYYAGQYLSILLRDGSHRSYSMASAPHLAQQVELHIRHMPGGRFTDGIFADPPTIKERDILRIEGPHGSFFLREDSDKPIVLLASGTGFAPIKAIVEHAIRIGIRRPMRLYWGCRVKKDLYLQDAALALVEQAQAAGVDLRYVPVLSEPRAEDAWTGRTGFVHRAVIEDLPDLSGWQVYACGAPVMVDAAHADFTKQCGLPDDEFLADAFVSEADKAHV